MKKPQIIIIESFISNADYLFNKIRNSVTWDERIKARKTASFGVSYNYSGMSYPKTEMADYLIPVCQQINFKVGYFPNNCLINYYLDGNSTMGYHSDSVEELQTETGVVIISLGAERNISYRSKLNKKHKIKYKLENGSLLYINDEVQKDWMHAVPKESNAGERISLTFRKIIK